MKKVLLTTMILSFVATPPAFAAGYGYLSAPNEGNRNFSTLMKKPLILQIVLTNTKKKEKTKKNFLTIKKEKLTFRKVLKHNSISKAHVRGLTTCNL